MSISFLTLCIIICRCISDLIKSRIYSTSNSKVILIDYFRNVDINRTVCRSSIYLYMIINLKKDYIAACVERKIDLFGCAGKA